MAQNDEKQIQVTLTTLWEEAANRYNADIQRYNADIQRYNAEYEKKHNHFYNIHKKRPRDLIPPLNSAKDFQNELQKRQNGFRDMRMKNHGVFKAMNSLATPVELIGGQAAAVGSVFNPAAPMVFGAVMYLFNAGRDVHESFNVLETLFTKCNDAISDVSMLVGGIRYLKIELQNIVIETLTAVLDVFRIATKFAKEKRLKQYAEALARPGKGGPEKAALSNLEDLGKRKDTVVGISTAVAVDLLDVKHDRTDRKIDVADRKIDNISSVQIDIYSQVAAMKNLLSLKKDDRPPPKTTQDIKQTQEDKARSTLKRFLNPHVDAIHRIKELKETTAPGTCNWILKEEEFDTWSKSPEIPVLWIYGESGAGKSHLAAHLVKNFGPSHLLGDKEMQKASVGASFIPYNDVEVAVSSDASQEPGSEQNISSANVPGKDSTEYKDTRTPENLDEGKPSNETKPMEVKTLTSSDDAKTEEDPELMPAEGSEIRKQLHQVKKMISEHIKSAKGTDAEESDTTVPVDEKPDVEEEPAFNPGGNETIANMLRTMCWQLVEDDKKYEKDLMSHLTVIQNNAGRYQPLNNVWKYLFQNNYLTSLQGRFVTLILDGVDNFVSEDRDELYTFLKWIIKEAKESKNTTVKFIILSQPTLKLEVARAFAGAVVSQITISTAKNSGDIETYMSWTVDKSPKLRRVLKDKKSKSETIKKLANCTGGVFEMGALLLKQLSQKDHVDLFSEVLTNPPQDIQGILQQTLFHFGDTHTVQDTLDLNILLSWVLFAGETLTLSQLNAAIGAESEHGEFLDIRDKVGREFSAYFTIVDLRDNEISDPSQSSNTKNSEGVDDIVESDPDDDLDFLSVTVAHASIAKFFRHSTNSRIQGRDFEVGVRPETANLRIAKTCLRIICFPEDTSKPWASITSPGILMPYAIKHFMNHLAEGKAGASLQDKLEIHGYLTKLFRDETAISRWVREVFLWPSWFDVASYLGDAWSWISDEDILKELKDEEKAWITEPCPSIAERMLMPMTMWFAKNWLVETFIDLNDQSLYLFIFMNALVKLFERSKDPETPAHEMVGDHPFDLGWAMDAQGITKIAEWANFEKTPLWHCRLGYNITDIVSPLTEECLDEYKECLRMDPDFGAGHFALATAYAELKKYDAAIDHMREARRLKYNEAGGSVRRGANWIAKWQDERATTEEARKEAMKTLRDELEISPGDFQLITTFVDIATKAGKPPLNRAAMSELQKLGSKLPDFLMSEDAQGLHRQMRRAAQQTRRVGVLKKAYEIAIKKAKSDQEASVTLMDALASLFFENQEEDKAIGLYRAILDVADDLDGNVTASAAGDKIAMLYFFGAWSKGGTAEERQAYVDGLIKLEKEEHSEEAPYISPTQYSYGLLLGLYYRLEGQNDKARAFFKDRIAVAMFLLDDDDADNDFTAWEVLSYTLFKAGDKVNGRAATGPWFQEMNKLVAAEIATTEDKQGPSKESGENEESGEGADTKIVETQSKDADTEPQADTKSGKGSEPALSPPKSQEPNAPDSTPTTEDEYADTPWNMGTCDGICDRDMFVYDKASYVCTYCLHTSFCMDCYELHKQGSIPYTMCDSDHEFVYMPGPPKKMTEEMIKVVDENNVAQMRNRDEWLDEIRKSWGLPPKVKADDEKKVVNGVAANNGVAV